MKQKAENINAPRREPAEDLAILKAADYEAEVRKGNITHIKEEPQQSPAQRDKP